MSDWKRPESIPYPSIWRTFQRKDDNGVEKTFWVQDVTDEYKEDFLNIVAKGFMRDEIICKSLNFIEDSTSVEEFLAIWRIIADEKLCLICLTNNDNGSVEIVGGNGTYTVGKSNRNSFPEFKGKSFRSLVSACGYVKALKNAYTTLNIDCFLIASGLYIVPKFRGQGIAVEILKSRRELCRAVGIAVSTTLFTSRPSQTCAEKAGFKVFSELTYEELEKLNPEKWTFPGVSKTTNALKYMYIDYREIL